MREVYLKKETKLFLAFNNKNWVFEWLSIIRDNGIYVDKQVWI